MNRLRHRRPGRPFRDVERLEPRLVMAAGPVVTEFMAKNSRTLADGNGNYSDWIEVQNQADAPVDLVGWHLSDDATNPGKWTFPDTTLAAGKFLVVFADGTGTPDRAGDLHANFALAAAGESVVLARPDGTVASEFLNYPAQQTDVSYGTAQVYSTATLVSPTAATTAYVPTSASTDGSAWTAVGYDDSAWTAGKLGVGYDTGEAQGNDAASPSADWVADDLTGLYADGGTVTSWVDDDANVPAASPAATAPTLSTGQLNGHAAVHFDGAEQLRVPAAANPLAGAGDFTVAVAFRTSTAGVGAQGQWYDDTGLVDATEAGAAGKANDWGLSLDSGGEAAAGVGDPDTTTSSSGGLTDGKAHVLVLTKTGTATALYVDGQPTPYTGTAGAAARDLTDLIFGALQTGANAFTGDLAEVRLYNSALTGPAAAQLVNHLDLTYGVALPPSLYAPLVNLNLRPAVYGQATTADVRVRFTIAGDASRVTKLALDVQYDDGFVAYLNGVAVAARNTAAGDITYTSTATAARSRADAVVPEAIDLSAYASLLNGNGGANVLAVRALTTSLYDPTLLVVPELVASTPVGVASAYFTTPTPGAANTTAAYAGFAATPTISAAHGYYGSAFTTTLADATPGATIYYTTDGSDPSPTHGTAIPPASAAADATGGVTVSASTPVRAAAYLDTYLPSSIATTTYLFVGSVLTQTNTAPSGAYWSSAVDPRVVNDAAQTYSVAQALTAIPSFSIVLPFDDMFGPNGIYPNSAADGSAFEKAASLEYFDPNDASAGFQINAGLTIQGFGERHDEAGEPKKSFRAHFNSQYGPSTLDYPLFGAADPYQNLNGLTIKAIHNFSWADLGGNDLTQADFVRDSFARDLQRQITGHASQGKWVQLYIDGQYWGLYDLVEEPDSSWAAANFGGAAADYDVVQPEGLPGATVNQVVDGSGAAYADLNATFAADIAAGPITDAEYQSLRSLVDVKGLVDYMLNVFYRDDVDAPVTEADGVSPRNFYAFRDAATNGPFEFTTWDGEDSLIDPSEDRTNVNGGDSPATLYQDLRTNPDFDQLVADETYRLFYNGGPLARSATANNPRALFDAEAAQIDVAVVGESARWGYEQSPTPLTRDGDWAPEIAALDATFFPARSITVLGELTNEFPMLAVLPPSFAVNGSADRGGVVRSAAALTLADQNPDVTGDAIYYTTDGTDPRAPGGGLAAAAIRYAGAVPVTANQTVTVRTLNGTTWSPVDSATYVVTVPAAAGNVAVTELDYHPADPTAAELAVNPTWTDSSFEYVELTNTSAATTILLTGVTFDKGVTATLTAGGTLAPGASGVVVSNLAAFRARYGTAAPVLGTYTGQLSNDGETVEFKSAAGAVIQKFAYLNTWYPRTDGKGSSLEVLGTAGNYNLASNYRPSFVYGGTPGSANVAPATSVVVNEILAAPAAGGQDAVELYNTTPSAVSLAGWYLSDNGNHYASYAFPTGTTIAAGGYLVVTASQFDAASSPTAFGLNGTVGDSLYLVGPAAAGSTALAFADAVTFGTTAVGESLGRTPDGTGGFYPQAAVTLGGANAGPRVGPVTITELMVTPAGGNGRLQYVEVQNQTAATIAVAGWQFTGGVTFTFPAAATLAPHEAVVVVPFNPATDPTDAAAFRAAYGLDATARLVGPFAGALPTAGADLRLVRPDAVRSDAPGYVPYVLVDDVTYGVTAPWPTTTAGQALTRLSNHDYGEDPANFAAAAPTPDEVPYGNAWFAGTTRYAYAASATLDSLTVAGSAVVTLATGGTSGYLDTGSLSLSATGGLNLGTGALVVTATDTAGTLAALTAYLRAGTLTSAAAADATGRTTVGLAANDDGTGTALYGYASPLGTFDGLSPAAGAVLARYTYFGDANLDGVVDGADYARLDAGYAGQSTATPLTGWYNGDVNYDGRVDGSDYTLTDNAFDTQNGNARFAGSTRYTYTGSVTLNSLTVADNAVVTLAAGPTGYVSAGTVSLLGSGVLNLGTGALVVNAAGTAGTLAALTADLSAGTLTSAAAADATGLTTVGIVANDDGTGTGTALYGAAGARGTFDGLSPGDGAVIARYTYFGDANLDGVVNGTDYGRIDAGYASRTTATPLTGWFNGDFNYDGKVDGSDYTLIDNAFNLQAKPGAAAVASAAAGVAEPAAAIAAVTAARPPTPPLPTSVAASAGPPPFATTSYADLYRKLKAAGILA